MRNENGQKILVAAHRGNSVRCPENTMAAFLSALTLPIDQIELDLHMTRDGEIILMHDAAVDRTTDGTGLIRDKTYAEMRRLDAGSKKDSRFRGEKVPAFRDFLELMQEHPGLTANVELKDYPEEDAAWAYRSAEKTLDMLARDGLLDRVWINSWSATLLQWIDRQYGRHALRLHGYYPLSCYKPGWSGDPMEILHCCCLWGGKTLLPQQDFDAVAARGLERWVFASQDTPAFYSAAVGRGISAITTNDPETCLAWMEAQERHPSGGARKERKA